MAKTETCSIPDQDIYNDFGIHQENYLDCTLSHYRPKIVSTDQHQGILHIALQTHQNRIDGSI